LRSACCPAASGGWSGVAAPDAADRRPAGRDGSVRVATTLLVALPARVGRPLSALVLVGVAMAAWPGDGRCLLQRRGGASGSVRAPCWWFCGDGGGWLPPGESSAVGRKSSPMMVGMMAALLGCRSPCWGRMARYYLLVAGGSLGENLVLLDVRWRRIGVVTFLKESY
jgi:hypothetical protein